ncbi:hypothetical protein THRCLA_11709 [Thraustotheca clavata]|uniref:CCDC93 coiled-coil domain-containing protein n=1 Tax=Thraustotheca clavata TaxID=74557 RepID=A0A1V9Y6X0_9STRA|nr:hypothetical protein THRCLA_11709 [Thraustotheca clavata]
MQVQEQSWRQSNVTDLKSVEAAVAVYDATSEEIRSQLSSNDPEALAVITERRRLDNEAKRWREKLYAQANNLKSLQAQSNALTSEVQALETAKMTASSKIACLEEKKTSITQAEHASNQTSSDLATLRELISHHTNLKLQESEFKSKCQEELIQLQKQVQDLTESQDKRLNKLDEKYKVLAAKRDQLKQELAVEVRGVLSTLRLIDDIPCKIELIQYEKRFMELYDEVALTLEETRKYFSFYNTLETTHEYLEKEVALIDSINANFEIALSSNAATDVFFNQMQQVIANIQTNVFKQQSLCQSKQLDIDTLDSKYQLLLEKQQEYVAAIRDFQKECEKNEKLQAHLV